ncbi:hypothetical protein MLD38_016575 [Melastoma candidum]|uniref:Uncharacterized protein n=1 Tax=Melastoma candidum TaxID=119954 RepID=A0ACB9QRA9_9MYRT|nr:hypothetical protein MLD38_016575 [Melastoma candidum]
MQTALVLRIETQNQLAREGKNQTRQSASTTRQASKREKREIYSTEEEVKHPPPQIPPLPNTTSSRHGKTLLPFPLQSPLLGCLNPRLTLYSSLGGKRKVPSFPFWVRRMGGNGSAAAVATTAVATAVAGGVGWPPFTMAQWQELEHQAMIFKYLKEGIPVPPELLAPIHRSLESMSGRFIPYPYLGYYSFYGKKIDPEPGRCRRTDGKKWRCSKDAHPDSKYCERHMNRGRYRSRKHVESKAASQSMSNMKSDMTSGSCSGGISFQYLPQSTPASPFTIGFGSALSSSQVESTYGNLSKYSEMKQDATMRCFDAHSGIGTNYSLSRAASEHSSLGNCSPLHSRYPTLQKLQELDYSSCDMSKQNKQNTLFGMEFSPPEPAKQPPQDFFYEWSDPREKNFFMDDQSCDRGSFSSAQLATRPGKDPSKLSSTNARVV